MEDDQSADIGRPLRSGEGTGRYQGADHDDDVGEDSVNIFYGASE